MIFYYESMIKEVSKLIIFSFALLLFLFGCKSTNQNPIEIQKTTITNPTEDPYYIENIATFSSFSLSNGIPVIYKNTDSHSFCILRIIFEGGVNTYSQKDALDYLTFALMKTQSTNYSKEELKAIEYNDSSYISYNAQNDYSEYSFSCPPTKLLSNLKYFADTVINPKMDKDDFTNLILTEKELLLQKTMEVNKNAQLLIQNAIYDNNLSSIYTSKPFVTDKSLNSISLRDIRFNYGALMNASRMKIVCVGSLSEEDKNTLFAQLELYFGKLESSPITNEKPSNNGDIQKILLIENQMKSLTNSETTSSTTQNLDSDFTYGFASCVFHSPSIAQSDYIAFALSTLVLDDILFREVREKYGAVNALGFGIIQGKMPIGVLSLYEIYERKELISLIESALKKFPTEEVLNERLDYYKNYYIQSIMSSSHSTGDTIEQITKSLEYTQNGTSYLERPCAVRALTSKEVIEAFNKYIVTSDYYWIVVDTKENLELYQF